MAKDMINSLTAVVTVKAKNEKERPFMKLENDGVSLFGKHYLLTSKGVSRQYTIARVMEKGAYTRIIKAL